MSKHNDIYNILGKLQGLEPAPAAPKQESVLKTLNEHSTSLVKRLNDRYQESKQLNEYFHFDMPAGKDRGPRDTGTDELARRSKLGKDPLIKHGAEYKQKDKYGDSYKIGGPKGHLPEGEVEESGLQAYLGKKKYGEKGIKALQQAGREGASKEKMASLRAKHDKMDEAVDQEGPADLLAAIEEELNAPGRTIDNLRDVLNATFGADRSPEFKKARVVIGKYLDLVDNAAMGSEQDGIAPMQGNNIARHIQQYDLTDYLQHAAAMLDKAVNDTMDEDVLIAKKDFDGDGKKESPKDEYMGSRDRAIKRSMGKDDKAEEGNKFTGNLAKARAAGKDQADLDGDGEMEPVQKEGVYQDKVNKSKIPAYQRKAKGGDDWRVDLDDLDDEASQSPTGRAGLEKAKERLRQQGHMEEGFPTVDDARKRAEQEKGTGKFDKQTTSTGTRYTRKPETYSDDGEETGGSSDAPKKRGRPKKNTGPERVTSKAWKHKGGRKTNEAINLESIVEDTMQELDDLLIMEKSVSKAQQRFMGMVYAAKKGDKPASKEVAKAAKGMSKKDAKDFAKTKHKGLPDRVDESVKPANPALDGICYRYGKECNDFMTSGVMDDDLYHALHDHYYDDMPAAVKRGADTRDWVEDQFYSDMGGDKYSGGPDSLSTIPPSVNLRKDDELNELARLAGLEEGMCNMTAEGQYCEVHGMNECGMSMYEGKGNKPDFLDMDKDGDKEEPMKKAIKDKEKVDECDMSPMGSMPAEQDSGMSVSTSVDTRTGRKTINISADGETAEQIAQILKMAGLASHQEVHAQPQAQVVAIGEEFANKPEVDYEDADAIFAQGGDLNKKKKQDPKTANKAANPLKEEDNEIVERLRSMYNRF